MQITADVNVPNDLLQAARSGRLVLFIGAGVSLNPPSNLPLFNGLAKMVATKLGEPFTETENPDTQLGDLQSRHSGVKDLVRSIIGDKVSLPNETHRAVARLADATGAPIVSTNYDEHVESAARAEAITLGSRYVAPALPLGREFEGIVYLHGSISEASRLLVLTDEDFGRAYLTDGWARRFAHELFMNWTVLFVGYSHNDVVMTYLARGLPSGSKRYVLTDEPNHKRWRPLSITPIAYPAANRHGALATALDAWADLMNMGQLDHYSRVREAVAGPPPKAPEEIDYLADAVTTIAGVNAFASLARGYDWLKWAESQPGFRDLFQAGRRGDVVAAAWADWFVAQFVLEPANSAIGLGTIARLGPVLSADFVWRISRAQRALHASAKEEARRWDAVLTASLRIDSDEGKGLWYQPYSNPLEGHELLPSLRRALVPRLRLSEEHSFSLFSPMDHLDDESTEPAGVSVAIEWSISEGSLALLWEKASTHIETVALDALHIAEQALSDAYALLRAFESDRSFDSWSFRRSAIEPHSQDQFADDEDVLIDILRDCGAYAAKAGESPMLRWLASSFALFKRLGVHLLVLDARTADQRLPILLDRGLLFDLDAKHEVFQFLAHAAPNLSFESRDVLLAAVVSGPPKVDSGAGEIGYSPDVRAIFDRLEWMQRYAHGWTELDEALEEVRLAEPGIGTRPHPDHDTWFESGIRDGRLPVTVDEFVGIIATDGPWRAVGSLVSQSYAERSFSEPSWDDAVRLVRETAKSQPRVAMELYPHLTITPLRAYVDMVTACIYGWADSELNDTDLGDVVSLIELIDAPRDLARPISDFILRSARKLEKGDRPDVLTRLDALARGVWERHSLAFEEPGWSDAVMRGLNTWPGFLAQYWVQRISLRWQGNRDGWIGLSESEKAALTAMLPPSANASAASATIGVLCADFAFLFAADRVFAAEHILPLFDQARSASAADAWFSFLHSPRLTPEMLDSGFWELLLDAENILDALSSETIEGQYWRLVASVTAFSTAAVVDRSMFFRELARRPRQGSVVSYLRALGEVLGSQQPGVVRQVWDRWLCTLLAERCSAPVSVLSGVERSAWGDLALDIGIREAIEISGRAPGPLTGRTRFSQVPDPFAADNAALLIAIAQSRLAATEMVDWHTELELRELVDRVGSLVDPSAVRALIEAALAKNIVDALNWMVPGQP